MPNVRVLGLRIRSWFQSAGRESWLITHVEETLDGEALSVQGISELV